MVPFDLLESLWNDQIERIRTNTHLKEWITDFGSLGGPRNSFCSTTIPSGLGFDWIVAWLLNAKQLTVLVKPDSAKMDPTETKAEFTRNLPHDIQMVLRSKKQKKRN